MALTKRQMEEYSGMSFEDLCDLVDQYKSDEEDLNDEISKLKEQIVEMESAINELQSDIYNGRA